MKKVILVLVAIFSLTVASAQTNDRNPYVSLGYSYAQQRSGESLGKSCYPTIEVGYMKDNIGYGLVIGRGDFKTGKFMKTSNFYWEAKIVPTYPIGKFTASIVVGAGAYFGPNSYHDSDKTQYLGEIGVGLSYSVNKMSYGLLFSNWDNRDYLTPSITYNF